MLMGGHKATKTIVLQLRGLLNKVYVYMTSHFGQPVQ